MSNDDRLLTKVLEIVEVMGELRQQMNGFLTSCSEKDCDTQKVLDDMSKRLSVLETEGSAVLREILKNQESKLNEQLEAIKTLANDLADLKKTVDDLKVETTKKNWRNGVIIGFITLVTTLGVTELLQHIFKLVP